MNGIERKLIKTIVMGLGIALNSGGEAYASSQPVSNPLSRPAIHQVIGSPQKNTIVFSEQGPPISPSEEKPNSPPGEEPLERVIVDLSPDGGTIFEATLLGTAENGHCLVQGDGWLIPGEVGCERIHRLGREVKKVNVTIMPQIFAGGEDDWSAQEMLQLMVEGNEVLKVALETPELQGKPIVRDLKIVPVRNAPLGFRYEERGIDGTACPPESCGDAGGVWMTYHLNEYNGGGKSIQSWQQVFGHELVGHLIYDLKDGDSLLRAIENHVNKHFGGIGANIQDAPMMYLKPQ